MSLDEFRQRLNEWGRDRVPFLFVVDFEMKKPRVWKLDELGEDVLFDFNVFFWGNRAGIQRVEEQRGKADSPKLSGFQMG